MWSKPVSIASVIVCSCTFGASLIMSWLSVPQAEAVAQDAKALDDRPGRNTNATGVEPPSRVATAQSSMTVHQSPEQGAMVQEHLRHQLRQHETLVRGAIDSGQHGSKSTPSVAELLASHLGQRQRELREEIQRSIQVGSVSAKR